MEKCGPRDKLIHFFSFIFIAVVNSAYAAQVTLEASALEKLLKTQVFIDEDRYYLGKRDECFYPYLETPTATIRGGRIYVKTHFTGRIGKKVLLDCIGIANPSWLTISGKPYFRDDVVGIDDLKLEDIEKIELKSLVEGLIAKISKDGFNFKFKDAIRDLVFPAKTYPYEVNLSLLNIYLISVDGDKLVFDIDIKLNMR